MSDNSSSGESMDVSILNDNIKFGFHMKKFPTFTESVSRLTFTPMNAMQIYISSPRSKVIEIKPDTYPDILNARNVLFLNRITLVIHGCLLYNLAGAVGHRHDKMFEKSLKETMESLTTELDIQVALGGIGVIVHIGACKYREQGIFTIARSIECVLTKPGKYTVRLAKLLGMKMETFINCRRLILENASGSGNQIGWNINDLSNIYDEISKSVQPRVSFCIDTAHSFGAGILDCGDGESVEQFLNEFSERIGLEKLSVIHLNDSRRSKKKGNNAYFNSKKDRHENIGLGWIFSTRERLSVLGEFLKRLIDNKIIIIGEPPHLTDDGNIAPGGRRDWGIVRGILEGLPDKKYHLTW